MWMILFTFSMSLSVHFFPGSFQPFHNGHLIVLRGMAKVCERIVVGIGSAQASGTAEHPFSAAERREMIQRSLQALNLIPSHDISFVDLPDIKGNDEAWVKQCRELVQAEIAAIWTGKDEVKACFETAGLPVKTIKPVPGISTADVRRRVAAGEDWKELVPADVADYLVEIGGIERLRKLMLV